MRLAATTIGRSDTALGAFYRRLSSRIDKQKAVTATARKIAVLFYNALRFGMTYHDPGAAASTEPASSQTSNVAPKPSALYLPPYPTQRLFLRKAVVGSTGHRNGSFEGISRRLEAKRFSRPCVEPEGDLIKVMLSVDG